MDGGDLTPEQLDHWFSDSLQVQGQILCCNFCGALVIEPRAALHIQAHEAWKEMSWFKL